MIPLAGRGKKDLQGLVYILLGICAAAIGIAAYFLVGMTPIESVLLGLIVIVGGALVEERAARRRAFARLERGVEEMSRLLATDARAGQVLSQRVNALADLDLGPRLEVVEADMSVLGTVVRQVAEAVSELESARPSAPPPADAAPPSAPLTPPIALARVRQALAEGRLVHHVQPVVRLPQRKLHAYVLVPRLELDGRLVDPAEAIPAPTPESLPVIGQLEALGAREAVDIARRARLYGEVASVLLDLSMATLGDRPALDRLLALLAAHRAVCPDLVFTLAYGEWVALDRAGGEALAALVRQGVGLAIRDVATLRLDFAGLAERGVRYVTASARTFLGNPAALTDFHSSDINDYIKRFGIDLLVTGTQTEADILGLLDDGIRLARGEALGRSGPLAPRLRGDDEDALRQVAAR